VTGDALKYRGHPYVYGVWDCSGFVNHVLGQDLGLAIPGYSAGSYKGPPPHGPVVIDYATWTGATTTRTPAPGDLVIWPGIGPNGHIGIYLGPDKMISALSPQYGTAVTPINGYGPAGVSNIYRRVTGAPGGTGTTAAGGIVGDIRATAAGALAGLVAAGATIAAVIGAAALTGALAAAGMVAVVVWLSRQTAAAGGE
jgi:cell wall-associated NlpC family hydrolase